MWWNKRQTRIAVTMMLGIALLLSGGVSQVAGESLIAGKPFAVTEPEFLEVSEPEFLEVSELEFLEASELGSLQLSNPKSLKEGGFPKGKYVPVDRGNPAYDRCAKLKDFDSQLNCALEGSGITPEDID